MLLVYLAGVTAWGAWLGRGQTGGRDYFLGNRELPWAAVMLSVVATETSTLTFLSIPAVSYLGTLGFLQLTFGYGGRRWRSPIWRLRPVGAEQPSGAALRIRGRCLEALSLGVDD